MKNVIVSQRFGENKIHICAEDNSAVWEWGWDVDDAIQRLLITHPNYFPNGIGNVINRGIVTQDLRDIKQ